MEERSEDEALEVLRLEAGTHAELVREAGEPLAMQLGWGVLGLDRVGERSDDAMRTDHLRGHASEPEHAPHPRHELRLVIGLAHEVVGARVEAGDHVARLGLAGDEDDRQGDRSWVGTKPAADIEPVHRR